MNPEFIDPESIRIHLSQALRNDFPSFHRRAFREINPTRKLDNARYLDVMHFAANKFAKCAGTRMIINIPPRHLKTNTFSVCLAAWMLAKYPGLKIMIVTSSEKLAKDIARDIRKIMRSRWFLESFSTRLQEGHEAVLDFGTTAGGGVYAVTAGGAITGSGGDIIIVDDFHHIDDAENLRCLRERNNLFSKLIEGRLADQKNGRILVVEHRIHRDDLSGYLLARGDSWCHVKLPLIAPEDISYETLRGPWLRKKGELLRPGTWTEEGIRITRAQCQDPDFDTLYQQDPAKGLRSIEAEFFPLRSPASLANPRPPVVFSIDTNQRGRSGGSFHVIQAWCRDRNCDVLLDQYRGRCSYCELLDISKRFIKKYWPSAILIEQTAQGPSLRDNLAALYNVKIIDIPRPDRPKAVRLAAHIDYICAKKVHLLATGNWVDSFIEEFVEFPNGESDDIVDTTTQYLDYMATNPQLVPSRPLATGVVIGLSSVVPFRPVPPPAPPAGRALNVIASRGRRWW